MLKQMLTFSHAPVSLLPFAATGNITLAEPSARKSSMALASAVLGALAIAAIAVAVGMGPSSAAPAAALQQPVLYIVQQPKMEVPAPSVMPEAPLAEVEMYSEEQAGHDDEEEHEYAADLEEDEWAEFSPGNEELFEGEIAASGEEEFPWDQSLIAGPIRLDAALVEGLDAEHVSGDHTALFARLAGNGELFLFAESESPAPLAMVAIDGCAHELDSTREVHMNCFAVHTMSGRTGAGCVGDDVEAEDWASAFKGVACQ